MIHPNDPNRAPSPMGGGAPPPQAAPAAEPAPGGGGAPPVDPASLSPEEQQFVMDLVQMLLQGVSPEELLQQGAPRELIELAIYLIQQEEMAQGGAPAEAPPV